MDLLSFQQTVSPLSRQFLCARYANVATLLTHLNVPDIQIGQQVPAESTSLINSTESITSRIVDCICCNIKAKWVKSD